MAPLELAALGVAEARERIGRGTLSPVALVEACLERIGALDATVQAWVHVDAKGALAAARLAEHAAVRGPLHGIPVAVKDIFDVAGLPTTAGAPPFAHRRPDEDAASVALLRAAGAIVLGKTHTTQFAYRDPAPTRNPWNLAHTPGGSSSGSAAAVAARMVPLALGSQTVGSVLRPAAYCGVVGFKPTHGLVPTAGVIPLAWSLDHVGVFTREVADAAAAFAVLARRSVAAEPCGPPRLALAPELLRRASREVAAHVQATADAFARAGATITEVKLPGSFDGIHAVGQTVLGSEAAASHEPRFAKHADQYGPEIRRLVETGLTISAVTYLGANRARLAFREEVLELLAAHDGLLSPTAPAPAPEGLASTGDASLCAPWSFAGVPAISLPSGLAPSGLPLAIQLVQTAGASARLLSVAAWCERQLAFTRSPGL